LVAGIPVDRFELGRSLRVDDAGAACAAESGDAKGAAEDQHERDGEC
jgi:hypothetical protein